jgi:GWxTD domain-containing protein
MSLVNAQKLLCLLVLGTLSGSFYVAAQNAADTPASPAQQQSPSASSQDQAPDPLKRPVSASVRKEQAKKFKAEVSKTYKKWLDEDVRWIITDEEKRTFMQLSNDEERDQFIEQFWLRRDPTPDTPENEFKEEHYRRIAYANEHFAAGIPGWRTDRGRMYIMYGPPDQIDAHPAGGTYDRPSSEGGGTTSTFPFETWRYRNLEGIGQEVEIEFVDTCMCGDYHMTIDRSEKDALLRVPNAGLTQWEAMGLADKTSRFTNSNGLENLGLGPFSDMNTGKEFERLETYAKLNRPPAVKFKDLEAVVTHKISMNLLPFDVRADFIKVTGDTVLTPITLQVQNRDVTFVNKDGVQRATLNIFGRLTTLSGRIAQTFEDSVQIDTPADLFTRTLAQVSVYWKAVPLRPGRYRLDLVVKDVNGDRTGTWSKGIMVPEFSEDHLSASSLILADQMEKVASRQVGTGNFIIGDTKVRPRVSPSDGRPAVFKRDQRAAIWMQVYNLAVDQQTHKPDATIEYNVVNVATNQPIVHAVESTAQMGNIGEQVTLKKTLPLASVAPGTYQVSIKIDDKVSKQTITPTARFAVE